MSFYLRPPHYLLVAALLVAAVPVAATVDGPVEIEGVAYDARVDVDGVALELKCVGLLRYMVFIKGYVAALYADPTATSASVLDDVAKRLELSYFWDIEGAKIGPVGREVLAKNVDAETLAALAERLDRIGALYEDVEPGDRYSLTYVPGKGTELALNGERKGVIPGADFARAYFSIWLGEQPIDDDLRRQLLECRS